MTVGVQPLLFASLERTSIVLDVSTTAVDKRNSPAILQPIRMPPSSNNSKPKQSVFDRPIALALLLFVILYALITAVTYHRVSQDETKNHLLLNEPVATRDLQQEAETTTTNNIHPDWSAIHKLQSDFPIHVTEETSEEIPHPGYIALPPAGRLAWPKDLSSNLTVPKFFSEAYAEAYTGKQEDSSIREFLGDNGNRLLTHQEAAAIGSKVVLDEETKTEVPTIYCSVASYRDPECPATIADLYQRAKHPERIRVAILDQRRPEDPICAVPPDCSAAAMKHMDDTAWTLCKYKHLIDRMELRARHACGPVFARHLAHRHYRGEYFAMQIDAHVRFTEHWDQDLVKYWDSAKNEYAVLTTYLSDITGSIDPVTHASKHHTRPIMCQSDYEGQGEYKHLRHGQQPEGIAGITGQPTLQPFWAAGFSFARGHFVIQVPYDQHLPMVFQGEEISIGLRGFTYGYDYYTPERGVCFHMYAIRDNLGRKKIPLFWENGGLYSGQGISSMRRLNSIIGMDGYPRDTWITTDEEKYGLGHIRQPQTFFDVFGIHTEHHRVEKHLCRFVGKPMMDAFLPALRSNGMGLDYDKITYRFVDPHKPKQ